MATSLIESILLGTGDLTNRTTQSKISSGSVAPSSGSGNDGDVFILIAGASSDILVKASGTWTSALKTPLSLTMLDNTTAAAFSYPAAAFNYMTVEYSVTRGSNRRMGTMRIETDTSTASMTEFNISDFGPGDVGVTFSATISGSNVQVNYTTTSQSQSANLEFILKGWAG